jgi:peptide/nickel transport system substrate-binding protein
VSARIRFVFISQFLSLLLVYMPLKNFLRICVLSAGLGLSLSGCGGGGGRNAAQNKNWVIVHSLGQPEMLNPTNYSDANSGYIMDQIFQTLLVSDEKPPYVLKPQLAVGKPEISEDGLQFTYEIHPDAKWDNGSPITGEDVAFSLKLFRLPRIQCDRLRSYFDKVVDVKIDEQNPKKFTVVLNEKYSGALYSLSEDLRVMPRYVYDSKNVLGALTFAQVLDTAALKNRPELVQFADEYNSPKYQREKGYVVGSGPYELDKWVTDQIVQLSRKKNWWGDAHASNDALQAYPERIIYKIIKDYTTAVVALKSNELDVMTSIPAKDFKELENNPKVKESYHLSTPPSFGYTYFGMNMKPKDKMPPLFTDKKVRQAMAHIADPQLYNEKIGYGMGRRVIGPVSPLVSGYNSALQPIEHNLEQAKKLLAEAGWKDSNGNGVLDKMINGKLV